MKRRPPGCRLAGFWHAAGKFSQGLVPIPPQAPHATPPSANKATTFVQGLTTLKGCLGGILNVRSALARLRDVPLVATKPWRNGAAWMLPAIAMDIAMDIASTAVHTSLRLVLSSVDRCAFALPNYRIGSRDLPHKIPASFCTTWEPWSSRQLVTERVHWETPPKPRIVDARERWFGLQCWRHLSMADCRQQHTRQQRCGGVCSPAQWILPVQR